MPRRIKTYCTSHRKQSMHTYTTHKILRNTYKKDNIFKMTGPNFLKFIHIVADAVDSICAKHEANLFSHFYPAVV